jgi:hypothetical protein
MILNGINQDRLHQLILDCQNKIGIAQEELHL